VTDTLRGEARLTTWEQVAAEHPELVLAPELAVEPVPTRWDGWRAETAPGAVLRLTDAVCGEFGVLWNGQLLVDDVHYAPESWPREHWSPFIDLGRGMFDHEITVGQQVAGPALYVDCLNGSRNFGHFVHDSLPYAMLQRELADLGVVADALVPEWSFPSQEWLAERLFGGQVRRSARWARVEELLVPTRQLWLSPTRSRIPVARYQALAEALPELVEVRRSPPSGPPVYLWREWGVYGVASAEQGRSYTNGAEVDALLAREGYEFVDPLALPVAEVLSRLAAAPRVVSLHGAQGGNLLWANESADFVEMAGPGGALGTNLILAAVAGSGWRRVCAERLPDGSTRMDLGELAAVLSGDRP